MSDKEFPSCVYDVCAEFDCEETMALALIATRNELERTRKALEIAVDALNKYEWNGSFDHNGEFNLDIKEMTLAHKALEQITALEQKDK